MTEEEKEKFTLLVIVYIYFNSIPKFPGRALPDAEQLLAGAETLGRLGGTKPQLQL